ncbi:hypothetical protein [Candidatus Pyrohabitans sp.]
MRGVILTIIVLIFLTAPVFALTSEEKATIERVRLMEDSIWLFASVFLVFFSYQLRKIYAGGAMEKTFTLFTLAFGLMMLWKFLGVIQRVYGIEAELIRELIGEGGSGFMMGVAYYAMWRMLKGEE